MKEDLFKGRLWSEREKREHTPPPPPQEQRRRAGDKPLEVSGRIPYVAFEIKENPKRLHIRTALQGSLYPSYHYLADIRFDHDHETYFTLIYSFMAVRISGQNL